jgi:hypothetical protein
MAVPRPSEGLDAPERGDFADEAADASFAQIRANHDAHGVQP